MKSDIQGGLFRESVEKIQVWSKSDKTNGYLTWRLSHIYDNISLHSSLNDQFFRKKVADEVNNTFYVQLLFPP